MAAGHGDRIDDPVSSRPAPTRPTSSVPTCSEWSPANCTCYSARSGGFLLGAHVCPFLWAPREPSPVGATMFISQ